MNEPVWGGRGVVSRAYLSYVRRFPAVRGKLRVGRAIADHLGTLAVVGENGARFSLDPGEWITWMVALHGEHGIETRSVRRATALMRSGRGGWSWTSVRRGASTPARSACCPASM